MSLLFFSLGFLLIIYLRLINVIYVYLFSWSIIAHLMGTPFLRPKVYKARVGGISPQCGIEQIRIGGKQVNPCPSQSEQYLIGGRDESPPTKGTHLMGTPFLRPKAYNARVGGVSPQCGIEKIHVGGTQVNPYPSQSEQYLIRGRDESPPTIGIRLL